MEEPVFVKVEDYEPVARERLPPDVYDFYAGGAGDEWTLAENRRALERWVIRPRMLGGVFPPDPSTELLGARISFPVLVAPWAYQRMAHPDGELATARAAARSGTIMVVSSATHDYLEDVAAASDAPKWWQLYLYTDRVYSDEMLRRVASAGFAAICFTVDLPVYGTRDRDARNAFVPTHTGPDLEYDPSISWDDIAWVRERAPLPLLLKGIMTAEDARLALDAGVDGIVVSNHGARQLDAVAAPITVLAEIVDVVQGRVPVLVDGGFRRGTDVFKAIALGASGVLIGRPMCWGLTVAGEEGVVDVLRIVRREFENVMALAGTKTIADITSTHVGPA